MTLPYVLDGHEWDSNYFASQLLIILIGAWILSVVPPNISIEKRDDLAWRSKTQRTENAKRIEKGGSSRMGKWQRGQKKLKKAAKQPADLASQKQARLAIFLLFCLFAQGSNCPSLSRMVVRHIHTPPASLIIPPFPFPPIRHLWPYIFCVLFIRLTTSRTNFCRILWFSKCVLNMHKILQKWVQLHNLYRFGIWS